MSSSDKLFDSTKLINPELVNLCQMLEQQKLISFDTLKNIKSYKINNSHEYLFVMHVAFKLTTSMTKYKLKSTPVRYLRMIDEKVTECTD
ncbi:hypothetical protein NH340_JMT02464 [Sarcoptes scabiei]|nr:hypothetical protein NH340_JMT02464 [Sarcoptes scabiei]